MNLDDHPQAAALAQAVLAGTPLALTYQGLRREVMPTLLGLTKNGKVVLHALQFGGDSSKGPVTADKACWRFFYTDEIETFAALASAPELAIRKSEGEYRPPGFVAQVLAIRS
jgi:hypothetical protein